MRSEEVKGSVLLVEDDIGQSLIFKLLLENAGYEVVNSTNVENALEVMDRQDIDCVVSDLYMPLLNGAFLVQKLRASRFHKSVPIIVLTTAPDTAKKPLLDLGANSFCSKSHVYEELVPEVEAVLRH